MGSKMNALLRSISAPRKPKDLSFTEIVDILAQHVDPKPIIIAERYKFQTMFEKWEEPFPNVSNVEKLTILLKSVFHPNARFHGFQKTGHIVMNCPEKRASKANGGESKRNTKRKK